jgi:hypothetical protein
MQTAVACSMGAAEGLCLHVLRQVVTSAACRHQHVHGVRASVQSECIVVRLEHKVRPSIGAGPQITVDRIHMRCALSTTAWLVVYGLH